MIVCATSVLLPFFFEFTSFLVMPEKYGEERELAVAFLVLIIYDGNGEKKTRRIRRHERGCRSFADHSAGSASHDLSSHVDAVVTLRIRLLQVA